MIRAFLFVVSVQAFDCTEQATCFDCAANAPTESCEWVVNKCMDHVSTGKEDNYNHLPWFEHF